MPSDEFKEAVLQYIERGFRVIPLHTAYNATCSCADGKMCSSLGKHPIRNGWQTANQPGESAINTWWTGEKPRNVGVATGPDSGIFVLDVDPDNEGIETMKRLTAEHGREFLETYRVKTGSGGWHFYYTYPDFDLGNSAGKIGKGIDTRGRGGYVVTAPSISGKGPYKENDKDPIRDAPDWLLELLRPKERKASTPSELPTTSKLEVGDAERQRLDGYVKGAIDIEVGRLKELAEKGWDGPPWDITTFEVACNLIQLANAPWSNLSQGQAEAYVYENAPQDPGFDLNRIQAKVDSARNTVGDNETPYPQKTSAAFWLEDDEPLPQGLSNDNGSGNEPEASESANEADDFMADATADDAPEPIVIDLQEFAGIPTSAERELDPGREAKLAAAILGTTYRAREHIEVSRSDVTFWGVEEFIADPVIPDNQVDDLNVMFDWIQRNLRSATPELLWAAVATLVAGVDADAPVFVFKGGGPLLALLARTLEARPGDDEETLLAGPRISTKAGHEREIVFEFADEDIDLMPYAQALVDIAATTPSVTEWPIDHADHDDLEDIEDYRVAQLYRARRGLGSKPRDPDGDL